MSLSPGSILRRSLLLGSVLALCLLAPASSAPAPAGGELVARRAVGTHAVAKAKKRLRRVRRRRAAACRGGARARCRRLRALENRLDRRVKQMRRARPGGPVLHVAPGGRNDGAGTAADPLATLTEAFARAAGGERIVVAPGSYPRAVDERARKRPVAVVGPGDGSATVAGMWIDGGQKLDISGLRFAGKVAILYHSTRRLAQPAVDVALHDDEFTSPGGRATCIEGRNAVQNLSITDSHIHHCGMGFAAGAGGPIPQSRGLTLAGNRIEHVTGDAIQFGQWDDVRITGNAIDDIHDPAKVIHNDGIQLTGNSHRVLIAGNRITDSGGQLIFIQDAVGPIDTVTVENNLVARASAVAIQSQGATNARFVHNTVWRGNNGGLWLTQGFRRDGTVVVPKDTVVVNNVLSTYRRLGGAWTRASAGNAIACAPGQRQTTSASGGWTCFGNMGFVDAATGRYRLQPDSPARAVGSALATTPTDIDGAQRTRHVPGAFG